MWTLRYLHTVLYDQTYIVVKLHLEVDSFQVNFPRLKSVHHQTISSMQRSIIMPVIV